MSKVFRTLCVLGCTASVIGVSAASAQAKPLHVTGAQTTITPSSQVTQFLTNHGVTVTAVGPATLSGGKLTLPIDGGRAARSGKRGVARHAGGVEFTKGTHHLVLRHLILAGNIDHPRLVVRAAGHRFVLARMRSDTHTTSGKTVTLSGELTLSRRAAHRINHRFGKHLVAAGTDLGSLTSTITVG